MMDLFAQWDGPTSILLSLFILFEFREMRKTNARLVEVIARQDERHRMYQPRRRPASRPPEYVTITPAYGVPTHVAPEESEPRSR